MSDWFTLFLTHFGLIFALIDPMGYVPIFLAMTGSHSQSRRRQMLGRACVTAFFVLALFTFVGGNILAFFGITIPALQISGGLILLFIGFEMLNVLPVGEKLSPREETEAASKDDISIVPLAIPMLSGPAAIVAVIVSASKNPSFVNSAAILASVFVTLLITYFVLRFSEKILDRMGLTGLHVITRIMGLLICAMAVQFVIDGYTAISR